MNVREYLDNKKYEFGLKSDEELAVYVGVSVDAMNKWIQRKTLPKKWELIIGQMTKSPKKSGQSEDSETKKDQNVSLSVSLLQAGAGEGVYNFETQERLLSLNPAKFPFLAKEDIVAVEIVGESMEPTLRQGDYILITPAKEERQTEDGIYAIRVEGMIKVKLLQFKLDGTIKIISYNKEFDTELYDPKTSQVDFAIIGKKRLLISR